MAAHALLLACTLVLITTVASHTAAGQQSRTDTSSDLDTKKLELQNGLFLEIPKNKNATDKLLSFGIDFNKGSETEEGRGRRKKLFNRLLPLFIMPFILQSTLVPMVLGMLKFMLFKSLMVGKLALTLIVLNAFKNHNSFKGRKDEMVASGHYGYSGSMDEYGAYVN